MRQSLLRQIEADPPPGLAECVSGHATLLFEFLPGKGDKHILQNWLMQHPERSTHEVMGRLHEIPMRYTGIDLARVAGHTGLSVSEVIERHCAPEYRVDLIGFAPGFPYLDGLDPALYTPRLDSPRVRVAAGSVAIGGNHAGIYSITGPGGWNILGHTEVKLFDLTTAQCLLTPGDRIRFVPLVRETD